MQCEALAHSVSQEIFARIVEVAKWFVMEPASSAMNAVRLPAVPDYFERVNSTPFSARRSTNLSPALGSIRAISFAKRLIRT